MRSVTLAAFAAPLLCLATGAGAAIVEDAYLDLSVLVKSQTNDVSLPLGPVLDLPNTLTLDGMLTGEIVGDPDIARDYDLRISTQVKGQPPVLEADATVDIDISDILAVLFNRDEYSINFLANRVDALGTGLGLGAITGILPLDQGDKLSARVNATLLENLPLYSPLCQLFGAGNCAEDVSFGANIRLSLIYDDGVVDMAPVPLPASLPLLAAGLGGLGFLRRRRSRG